MTNINVNNAFVALPLDLHRVVWKFLIEFDPRNYMATMDYKSVASFMVTHKLAKETFDSLKGWKLCANAFYRESRRCFVSIRGREHLLRVCRLAVGDSATMCERHVGAIRQRDSSFSSLHVQVMPAWIREGMCVQVLEHASGWYESGVIKEIISDTVVTVEFGDGESMRCVPIGEMNTIGPRAYDRVMVTCGSDAGIEGELVCIDGTDAIIKDSNEEFKIVDYGHLAKIAIDISGGNDL